jgi:hypothetical protein
VSLFYLQKNGVEKFEKGWETSLFAPMASSMCGYIALETGKTYYISGKTKYIPENENKSNPWKCCRIKIIV